MCILSIVRSPLSGRRVAVAVVLFRAPAGYTRRDEPPGPAKVAGFSLGISDQYEVFTLARRPRAALRRNGRRGVLRPRVAGLRGRARAHVGSSRSARTAI